MLDSMIPFRPDRRPCRRGHRQDPDRSTAEPLGRVLASGLILMLSLWATPALTQVDPADAEYFDWPVGRCVDGKMLPGHGYYIQQDFDHLYPRDSLSPLANRCDDDPNNSTYDFDCYHAGLDLQRRDQGPATVGDPVFAAADGVVVGTPSWGGSGGQGEVVLVRHLLDDATVVYSQYGHLAQVWVDENQPVQRGEPLGTIMSWTGDIDNSHAHVELRERLRVYHCPSGAQCASLDYSRAENTSCQGPGYSHVTPDTASRVEEAGFLDPVDMVFAHRPPYPARIALDAPLEMLSTTEWPYVSQVGSQPANELVWSPGFETPLEGGTIEQGWFEIPPHEGERRYVLGYLSWREIGNGDGFASRLKVAEERRVGRSWRRPMDDPWLDLRFAPGDLTGTQLSQWAPGGPAVTVVGELEIELPWPALANLRSVEDEYCDQVGRFAAATRLEAVPDPVEIDFRGGLILDLRLWLDPLETGAAEQQIVGRWEEGGEQWKLAVEGGEVVLTVQPAGGPPLELRHSLPALRCRAAGPLSSACDADYSVECPSSCDPATVDPRCISDRGYHRWIDLGVVVDPLGNGQLRLYRDGRLVASAPLLRPLASSEAPVVVGEGLEGRLDDLRLWPLTADAAATLDTVLVIDSSGSMRTNDPGDRRLDAARAYVIAAVSGDYVGVVDFDGTARQASPLVRLPEGTQQVLDGLDTLISSGGTAIGAGLAEGCSMLGSSASDNRRKAVILLTDGEGSYGGEASCFVEGGWPVYTFGFGASDDTLLEQIASETGGVFRRLPTDDLVCEFQRVRAAIAGGSSEPCRRDVIHPGETVAFDLFVPPGQDQATFTTSWPGSDVVMTLETPSGRRLGRDTLAGDVAHDVGPTFEVYTVSNPEPGTWRVELYGADVDPQGEPVTFGFTSLPSGGESGNLPPDVSQAVPTIVELWPPNHRWVEVAIEGVSDPEGDPVSLEVVAIHQDEPVAGPGNGHSPDGSGLGTATASLRSERDGGGDGRVYAITFVARDPSGAEAVGEVRVCVPHDRSTDCGDGGALYDSTLP